MGTRRFATAENKPYLFSHRLGRFQCIGIWVPVLLLAEDVSSSIGSHIHFENFGLGRDWDVGWKKGQVAPFLRSVLLFWDAFFNVVNGVFLFDWHPSLSLPICFKSPVFESLNKFWGQSGSLLLKYGVEQFYLLIPAKGCWTPWSVVVAICLKEIGICAVFAVDLGLLTVREVVKATRENYSWFKYKNTTANP